MRQPDYTPGVNCAVNVPDPIPDGRHWGPGRNWNRKDATVGWRTGNPNVPMSAIITTVCKKLRVEVSEFVSKSRHIRLVIARELVSALATDLTRLSYPAIALAMNRPNHSSVIDARDRWYARLDRAEKGDQAAYIAAWRDVYEPKALYEELKAQLERTAA